MMLLIGILFIVRPQDSLEVTAIMIGIIFIINAVIDGVILSHIQKISRQSVEKIQDAIDELSGNIIDEDNVK